MGTNQRVSHDHDPFQRDCARCLEIFADFFDEVVNDVADGLNAGRSPEDWDACYEYAKKLIEDFMDATVEMTEEN